MKLNVALIGLGNISLLFDDNPDSKTTLSHAKALYTNKNFNLKYCIDIDKKNQMKILNLFPKTSFHTTTEDIMSCKDIDILVIATPTSTHYELLKKFQNNKNIKYFLIEKPLFDADQSLHVFDKDFTNKIIVNYIRIFEPNIQNLHKQIQQNLYGDPQKIILTYTKGIKNNGSHFISLVNYLFNTPQISDIEILSSQKGSFDDTTLDIIAFMDYNHKKIPLYMVGLDNQKYSVFDIDFYFENSKIRIEDTTKKMFTYKAEQDLTYSSYTTLNSVKHINLDLDNIMKYPYEYIFNIFNNQTIPINFVTLEQKNIEFYKNLQQKEFHNE